MSVYDCSNEWHKAVLNIDEGLAALNARVNLSAGPRPFDGIVNGPGVVVASALNHTAVNLSQRIGRRDRGPSGQDLSGLPGSWNWAGVHADEFLPSGGEPFTESVSLRSTKVREVVRQVPVGDDV